MQAIGLIETKGLIAAVESADAMLKAADVRLLEKTIVGGGLVAVAVTGDVAAVKAAVDAGAAAVIRIGSLLLVSQHVIPRPHEDLSSMIGPGEEIEYPAVGDPAAEEIKETEDALHHKEAVDRMILECGFEGTIEALGKLKVIDLRNLARRYMDFGITGRAVSKADKRLLLTEFRKYYGHK
ncbi:MAG TPA: BMC domain-containing protein [Clostridiaceae bacterium]|nr:BMC domain-containing protein [Clostridiaceae bacterium]